MIGRARWSRRYRFSPRLLGALALGALAITAVLIGVHRIAMVEADASSWVIRTTRLAPSQSIGTAVTYQMHGRWMGFAITGGCSVALLVIPPFLLTALLISVDRVSWVRGLTASAAAVVLLAVVNQVRLFVIASSMKWWGFQTGYERSHVLIGSGITTVGIALVAILFLIVLARRPGLRRIGAADHAV